MARPITSAKAAENRRSYVMRQRPPDMVERHEREVAELRDRQLAEAEAIIEANRTKAERERRVAKLRSFAAEIGVELTEEQLAAAAGAEAVQAAEKPSPPRSVTPIRPASPEPAHPAGSADAARADRPKVLCRGCNTYLIIESGETKETTLRDHYRSSPTCEQIAKRRR